MKRPTSSFDWWMKKDRNDKQVHEMIPETHFQTVLDIWNEKQEKSVCTIVGNCMSPVINEGDRLVVRHGSRDIRVGDVVIFGSPGEFYVHRVIRIDGRNGKESFLLKADQNAFFSDPVIRDEILGKVIEVHGSSGHFHLDSIFWKCLNPILSIRSCIGVKHLKGDSLAWKAINSVSALQSRILPGNRTIGQFLWRQICRVNKIFNTLADNRSI